MAIKIPVVCVVLEGGPGTLHVSTGWRVGLWRSSSQLAGVRPASRRALGRAGQEKGRAAWQGPSWHGGKVGFEEEPCQGRAFWLRPWVSGQEEGPQEGAGWPLASKSPGRFLEGAALRLCPGPMGPQPSVRQAPRENTDHGVCLADFRDST